MREDEISYTNFLSKIAQPPQSGLIMVLNDVRNNLYQKLLQLSATPDQAIATPTKNLRRFQLDSSNPSFIRLIRKLITRGDDHDLMTEGLILISKFSHRASNAARSLMHQIRYLND